MISKYMLLIVIISQNVVYSINMYFGRPSIPYIYSIPRNNVFQTLQNNFDSFYKRQDIKRNSQYEGNRLLQLPQVFNRNDEKHKMQQRSYVDRQFKAESKYPINHHIWNIQGHQALLRRYQSEKQKTFQEYLLKKQEEIKKQQEQEKLKREQMLKRNVAQHSKFLQRLYYENLLHREYDENELEMHRKNAAET